MAHASIVELEGASWRDGASVVIVFESSILQDDMIIVAGGFAGGSGQPPGVIGPVGFTSIFVHSDANLDFKIEWFRAGATPPTSIRGAGSGVSTDATAYGAYVIRNATLSNDVLNVPIQTSVAIGVPRSPSIITANDGVLVLSLSAGADNDTNIGSVNNFAHFLDESTNDTDDFTFGGAASMIALAGTIAPDQWTAWVSEPYVSATVAINHLETIGPDPFQSYMGAFSRIPKRFRNLKV